MHLIQKMRSEITIVPYLPVTNAFVFLRTENSHTDTMTSPGMVHIVDIGEHILF